MLAYWITSQLKRAAGPSGQGTVKTVIDWRSSCFLFLMVRTYLRRKDTRTPKWMGRLQTADVGFSFGVDLDGSRQIEPAHVACVVGPDGSRRIQKDRVDDQRDDQGASDGKADSKASFLSGLRHRLALRPSGLVYRP
jgi:hypothetical protein